MFKRVALFLLVSVALGAAADQPNTQPDTSFIVSNTDGTLFMEEL